MNGHEVKRSKDQSWSAWTFQIRFDKWLWVVGWRSMAKVSTQEAFVAYMTLGWVGIVLAVTFHTFVSRIHTLGHHLLLLGQLENSIPDFERAARAERETEKRHYVKLCEQLIRRAPERSDHFLFCRSHFLVLNCKVSNGHRCMQGGLFSGLDNAEWVLSLVAAAAWPMLNCLFPFLSFVWPSIVVCAVLNFLSSTFFFGTNTSWHCCGICIYMPGWSHCLLICF